MTSGIKQFLDARRAAVRNRKLQQHSALISQLVAAGYNWVDVAAYLQEFEGVTVSDQAIAKHVKKAAAREQGPTKDPVNSIGGGASQGSCRLIHAINCFVSSALSCLRMTASRSGLRVTAPIGDQSRVRPDQRAGFRSRAWRYV